MKNKPNNRLWIWPSVAALVLFCLNAWLQNLLGQTSAPDVLNVLANCFTVPGILLSGVGLLGWIASCGQFDMLSYSSRMLFGHFIRPLSEDLPNSFGEYRRMRDEKGRGWNRYILWVGLVCLLAAGVLLIAYCCVE